MAAATGPRMTIYKKTGYKAYPVKAAVKIWEGTLVCIDSTGYAIPAADAASNKCVGVARATADNLLGVAGDVWVQVEAPILAKFAATSITQAMVGTKMYVVDDQTFDDGVGVNSIVAGLLMEFLSTTEGWIYIDPISLL